MNRRQRRRQQARRAQHARTRTPDRPRLVLDRESYPEVKTSHIVPRMFQRAFAIDDQVAVHVDRREDCVLMPTAKAGTRSRYYRRIRPGGESIDDTEASLAVIEGKATTPLTEVIAGEPLTAERKGILAQFLAVQLLRGPAFFEQREELVLRALNDLEPKDFKPGALRAAGGDVERVRTKVADCDPCRALGGSHGSGRDAGGRCTGRVSGARGRRTGSGLAVPQSDVGLQDLTPRSRTPPSRRPTPRSA